MVSLVEHGTRAKRRFVHCTVPGKFPPTPPAGVLSHHPHLQFLGAFPPLHHREAVLHPPVPGSVRASAAREQREENSTWERSRGCKTKGFACSAPNSAKSPGLYLPNAGYRTEHTGTRLLYQFISGTRISSQFVALFPLSTGNREQFLWMQRSLLHLEKRQPVRPCHDVPDRPALQRSLPVSSTGGRQ